MLVDPKAISKVSRHLQLVVLHGLCFRRYAAFGTTAAEQVGSPGLSANLNDGRTLVALGRAPGWDGYQQKRGHFIGIEWG